MTQLASEISPNPHNRGGTDKIKKYGWTMVDKAGVPYLAAKTELKIDTTYQRTMITESRVLAIAQSWSWVACGSLIIAERADKSLWVVDGQHRCVAAMRRSDITELPCLVFPSDGVEEEALAFFRANCIRGNVSPYDKLRALLASGDPLAKDAVALMQSEGYEPAATDQKNSIRCIAKFLGAMRGDRQVLQRVWPIVAALHREAGDLPIRVRVLNALLHISKYGSDDITTEIWRTRIMRQGLATIAHSIDRFCALYTMGGERTCAKGALEAINKGVRNDHRIHLNESADADE